MAESFEREATDQPPPIHAPLTRRQIWSLIIPGVSLLLLTGVLLWGTLSSVRRVPAALPGSPSPIPGAGGAALSATVHSASPTPTDTATQTALSATVAPDAAPAPASPGLSATATRRSATALPGTSDPTVLPATPAAPAANARLPLLGRRIGLDPGHGPGGDHGAILVDPNTGKWVLAESEVNLDVALRCRALLQARGAAVVLTRETADSFTAPWPPDTNGDGIKGGTADDLQERIDILNAAGAEVFLSIHANSSADPAQRQGIEALYCAAADCPFPAQERRLGSLVLEQLAVQLAAVGDPVQRSELRNDFWSDTPGAPPAHLFLLGPVAPPRHVRAALMPGAVVEALYVTSPTEAAELKRAAVRQAIALAYADALQAFLTSGAGP